MKTVIKRFKKLDLAEKIAIIIGIFVIFPSIVIIIIDLINNGSNL